MFVQNAHSFCSTGPLLSKASFEMEHEFIQLSLIIALVNQCEQRIKFAMTLSLNHSIESKYIIPHLTEK